jgi:hypothetical protein
MGTSIRSKNPTRWRMTTGSISDAARGKGRLAGGEGRQMVSAALSLVVGVDVEGEEAIEQGRLAIGMPLGKAGVRRLLYSVLEKREPERRPQDARFHRERSGVPARL